MLVATIMFFNVNLAYMLIQTKIIFAPITYIKLG